MALVRQLPPDLRELALTHSSWVDTRTESYERLEFLGDSVLGLAIASALYQRYPESEEGDMARIKAFVVSRASCAQVAERLEIGGADDRAGPGAGAQAQGGGRTIRPSWGTCSRP